MADDSARGDFASRWQPVSVGGARYRYGEDLDHCASHGPSGIQGHRLHDLHAHGCSGTLQKGRPVGAHPADGGGNAEYTAAIHVHGISLHFVGDRAPGIHGAGVSRPCAQWHTPFLPGGPHERRGFEHRLRAHGEAGGGEYVIAALVFTLSPIHDDAHYAEAARKLAACPDVDALYIKDPGGLLSPIRARTLIPAIKAVIGTKPLELHSHCTIGLAEHRLHGGTWTRCRRSSVRLGCGRRWNFESACGAGGCKPARARSHGAC